MDLKLSNIFFLNKISDIDVQTCIFAISRFLLQFFSVETSNFGTDTEIKIIVIKKCSTEIEEIERNEKFVKNAVIDLTLFCGGRRVATVNSQTLLN